MSRKKKDKTDLDLLRDEVKDLKNKIQEIAKYVQALTFMNLNPDGVSIKSECSPYMDTAQWTGNIPFSNTITATIVDEKTMKLVSYPCIKYPFDVEISIGDHSYSATTGSFTYYITLVKKDKRTDYKIECNLHDFYSCKPVVTMKVSSAHGGRIYTSWVSIPTPQLDKGTLIFS